MLFSAMTESYRDSSWYRSVGRFGKTRPTRSERSCSVSLNRITPYRGEGKDGLPEQINGFCQAELQAANESGG